MTRKYLQVFNDLGIKVYEIEIKEGQNRVYSVDHDCWRIAVDDKMLIINYSDTVKIVEEEDE